MSSKKRAEPEARVSGKAKKCKPNQEPEEEEEEIVDTPLAPSPEEKNPSSFAEDEDEEAAQVLRFLTAGGLRRLKKIGATFTFTETPTPGLPSSSSSSDSGLTTPRKSLSGLIKITFLLIHFAP